MNNLVGLGLLAALFLSSSCQLQRSMGPYSTSHASLQAGGEPLHQTFKKVSPGLYEFAGAREDLWHAVMVVLLADYNLTLSDHREGLLSTGWDRFFRGNKLLQSRVTALIKPVSRSRSQVAIRANVQHQRSDDGLFVPDAASASEEVQRIVENLAKVLEKQGGMRSAQKKRLFSNDTVS